MASDNSDIMPQPKAGPGDSRRSFFKFLGLGAGAVAVAPNVKGAVEVAGDEAGAVVVGGLDRGKADAYERAWKYGTQPGMDIQDGVLYDRIRLKAGSFLPRFLSFFQVPVGQTCPHTGRVKTDADTSMWMAGCLPMPSQMLVQRVLFVVHPGADPLDLEDLQTAYVWRLKLLEKTMHRGTLLLNSPAYSDLSDIVKAERKPSAQTRPVREPLPENVLASAHQNRMTGGLLIPSLAYFVLNFEKQSIEDTALRSDLDLLVGLQGAEVRGIQ